MKWKAVLAQDAKVHKHIQHPVPQITPDITGQSIPRPSLQHHRTWKLVGKG